MRVKMRPPNVIKGNDKNPFVFLSHLCQAHGGIGICYLVQASGLI